ncbi:right-handed parallel beta-helix repeat-containing protein [Capillimicrobium parvum]|uniref:Pectate lyase superfamily protein domain-containing protein n=1 Tax=Capillimicrobium parvum TaxID=2884022 RepID=A0A9E6XYW5_9ACTN|nr:hypothetical protein [Capillimicrobium parvum]UGS36851.1 hypothetical protein DSM104329_03262 [Capillimicrobium parvum]
MTVATRSAAIIDLRDHFEATADPGDPEAVALAFASAAAEVEAARGGTIYVPPGEWLLAGAGDDREPVVRLATPGTRLLGAGMRATRLRLAPGENRAVVGVKAPGVTLERLTVRGNLDAPPPRGSPHGITMRGDPTFFTISDVVVESVCGYGIFVRAVRDDPGLFTHVMLRNVVIDGCGNDGIDFKVVRKATRKARYRSPGPRAYLRSVSVRDHSVRKPLPGGQAGERGIDVRGQLHMHGIEILAVKAGTARTKGALGVAFRPHGDSNHGRNGGWSTLENYFISLRPPPDDEGRRGWGISAAKSIATSVIVANGTILEI